MDPLVTNIILVILFVLIFLILGKSNLDIVTFSLFIAIIACVLTALTYDASETEFIAYIPYRTLIYLIAINIIIIKIEQQKIFQFIAIKLIHFTKSNPRNFFYIICTFAALFSAFMEDISVCVIFIPLTIRATRILKMKSEPYIIGITLSITIGNLLTPYASPSNILFSDVFGIGTFWFFSNFAVLFIVALVITLVTIEFRQVKMLPPPDDYLKAILLEIMDPDLLIVERKAFIRNSVYLIVIFTLLILLPYAYLTASIGALVICILERDPMSNYINRIEWRMIFFLIALFLMIGCLSIAGLVNNLGDYIITLIGGSFFWALVIVLLTSSLLSSFTSKSLVVVLFASMFDVLFSASFTNPSQQNLLLIAMFLGINLGGTLVPHGSSYILKTIEFIKNNKIEELSYAKLMRVLFKFSAAMLGLCFVYLMLYEAVILMFT